MDRLLQLEVFVAVVENGSFAKAAERLRISPPAVTRAVSALEDRLGARLLTRTTRTLKLTEAGTRFLESSRRLIAEFAEAEEDVSGRATIPQGHLTITASVTFGRLALGPIVQAFLAAHPRVTVSLMMVDRIVNLVDEGIDVGIRIGSLPDSSVVARRIGQVRRVLVASPRYIKQRGAPDVPADLKLHTIIGFTGVMANGEWRYLRNGRTAQVALKPRFEVNDAATAIAAAEAGAGITHVPCYMIGDSLRTRRLVPVLEDYWPSPVPVQMVFPTSRLLAPKVRAFLDFATPRLAAELKRLSP